jgi:hypothetical protein
VVLETRQLSISGRTTNNSLQNKVLVQVAGGKKGDEQIVQRQNTWIKGVWVQGIVAKLGGNA